MEEGRSSFEKRRHKKERLKKKMCSKRRIFSDNAPQKEEPVEESLYAQAAQVMAAHGETCEVVSQGDVCSVSVKNTVKQLVVGDFVLLDQEEGCLVVVQKLPRKTFIARLRKDNSRFSASQDLHVLAGNVTRGVIVESCTLPTFHPGSVDRYLILCAFGGVRPLLCLTKRDLVEEVPESVAYYRDVLGVDVVEISSTTGAGLEDLQKALHGEVAVLFGKSGVGKSTLINALIPHLALKTTEVHKKMKGGRHTTTASCMYRWDEGSYVIDTPGMKALNLDHIPQELLEEYFTEFASWRKECKYRDCTHVAEDGCGVRRAVASGDISTERYERYVVLRTS